MQKTILVSIFLSCYCFLHAQSLDLAKIEYTYMPQAGSDNEFSRLAVFGKYPIKLNDKETYLIADVNYSFNRLDLQDAVAFDDTDLERYHSLGVGLGYTFRMKNNWRFSIGGEAKISSNFESSAIGSDDFVYAGSFYFIKSNKDKAGEKPSKLVLGLYCTIPFNIFSPLPIVNYYKKFHANWSYAIGTPVSNIKHFFNKKHTLQAYVGMDRLYGNVQHNRIFVDQHDNRQEIANASMFTVVSALGYEYYFTEHLLFYTNIGYTLTNEIRLRNVDQENVVVINDKNTICLRSGLKFKI